MKKTTGAAIALTAVLATGGLALAIPSQAAAPSSSSPIGQHERERGEHIHATISATVTGIPSTVTSSRQVAMGAYFSVYVLADSATAPATAPSDSHRIHLGKNRSADAAISGSTLTTELHLRAGAPGTSTSVALYPSDGSAPAIVTVAVDANSVVTVSSSKPLTVAYSAAVAAQTEANRPLHPEMRGPGPKEGKGRGHSEFGRDAHRGEHRH